MSGIRAHFDIDRQRFRLKVDLDLPGRGVTALFGQSGSGKTTVLRCVAGLERAPNGRLIIGEETWQDEERGIFLQPWRRPIGYVFQEPRLFPHLRVRRNLEFGLKRTPASLRRIGWDKVVDILGIGHLLDRWPGALSGGEKQRVAIGRALLTSPRLMLMDEPLASLDQARKNELLPFIQRMRSELDIPIFYVTHSTDEVIRIADHIVLLSDGQVKAFGTVAEVLSRLDLGHLTGERDVGAVVETTVESHEADYGLTVLGLGGQQLRVPRIDAAKGTPIRIRIHARDVSVALTRPAGISILNVLPARIVELGETTGAVVDVRLDAGAPLWARLSARSVHDLGLKPGLEVFAMIKSIAFDRD